MTSTFQEDAVATWSPGARMMHYALATCGTSLITAVQVLGSWTQAPLFCMYFWCLTITRLFGFGPGLLTVIVSSVAGNFFFLRPVMQFTWHGPPAFLTSLFALMTTTSVWMQSSMQRYALQQRELLNKQRQLLQNAQKSAQRNESLALALQKAVHARDDFLAIAGHELKTPVTALSLQAQSWRRRLCGRDRPRIVAAATVDASNARDQAVEAWSRQARGLERLCALIDDLLDVSGIHRGRLTLNVERLDLRELVQEVVARLTDVAAKSGCTVSVHAKAAVWGSYDRRRVEQVVGNLLMNALKYGAGTPVDIALRTDGPQAVIEVSDGGRGIAPGDQFRIFECFERARPDPSTSGLGLGLFIARQIVDASGGRIEVSSEVGQGTCFKVEVPLDASCGRATGNDNPMSAAAANPAAMPRLPPD